MIEFHQISIILEKFLRSVKMPPVVACTRGLPAFPWGVLFRQFLLYL